MDIAILGFGTVGSGVYELIKANGAGISKRAKENLNVKYILDIRDFSEHKDALLFTKNYEDILNDESVKVVAEVIGGIEPAYTYTKMALKKGKSVVTSNKELVATHGYELLKLADENDCHYLFEASVGGGIPIIRPLDRCLAANEITEIMGILNGTTNYILTRMLKSKKTFEQALEEAREKGYAERNPAADIEGHDTCRKIAILSSLVFGKQLDYAFISTEGIEGIDLDDTKYAAAIGGTIKLIGYSKIESERVYARVSPMILSNENSLAKVDDVYNGICIFGNAVGEIMFYGKGAGKLPTASAVVADIIDVARGGVGARIMWDKGEEAQVMSKDEIFSKALIRTRGPEQAVYEAFPKAEELDVVIKEGERGYILPLENEGVLLQKLQILQGFIKMIRIEN